MCTHLLAQVSQWSLRHFTKINLAWPKGHDTIRCLALGAEVPEYCPGQILQTLIVRLLKRLWVSVNQNFSNVPPTLPPFSTPWAKSSWSILRVQNPQCSLRGQLSRHTHFTHDCSIITTTTTPTFCYCSHKKGLIDLCIESPISSYMLFHTCGTCISSKKAVWPLLHAEKFGKMRAFKYILFLPTLLRETLPILSISILFKMHLRVNHS